MSDLVCAARLRRIAIDVVDTASPVTNEEDANGVDGILGEEEVDHLLAELLLDKFHDGRHTKPARAQNWPVPWKQKYFRGRLLGPSSRSGVGVSELHGDGIIDARAEHGIASVQDARLDLVELASGVTSESAKPYVGSLGRGFVRRLDVSRMDGEAEQKPFVRQLRHGRLLRSLRHAGGGAERLRRQNQADGGEGEENLVADVRDAREAP